MNCWFVMKDEPRLATGQLVLWDGLDAVLTRLFLPCWHNGPTTHRSGKALWKA